MFTFIFIFIEAKHIISKSTQLSSGLLVVIVSNVLGIIFDADFITMWFELRDFNLLILIDTIYIIGLILMTLGLHEVINDYIHHSNYDELTGLNTRKRLVDMPMTSKKYALIYIDLDGLKQVNDKKGHHAGDEMLVNFSEILKASDYLQERVRMGGDEFVVLCPVENALGFISALIESCNALAIKFSYGVTKFDFENVNLSIQKADVKMYEMKNTRKKSTK